MFARIFNDDVFPLYIGKAERLGVRVRQHFKHSIKLMNGIKKSKRGSKVLIIGQFVRRPRQDTATCVGLIERALIDHALAEGYELLNVQGTRAASHSLHLSGPLNTRNITGKTLSFKVMRS